MLPKNVLFPLKTLLEIFDFLIKCKGDPEADRLSDQIEIKIKSLVNRENYINQNKKAP